MKSFLVCLLLVLTLQQCKYYFIRDSSKSDLNAEELSFLKSKKFALVGFHPFYYKLGTNRVKEQKEPVFPCSFYESLLEVDRNLAVYNCVVEFINQGNKELNPELNKKLVRLWHGEGSYSTPASTPAYIDYKTSTSLYFPTGQKVNHLKDSGTNSSISLENRRNFLLKFLSEVRHSGLQEVEAFTNFEYTETNEDCNCNKSKPNYKKISNVQIKQFDVDYWIIAHHGRLPGRKLTLKDNDEMDISLKRLTLFLFAGTMGTLPYWGEEIFESNFYIYDSKLNLIYTLQYQSRYDMLNAWWVLWKNKDQNRPLLSFLDDGDDAPISVYEPDVKKFTKDLYHILNKK